MVFILLWHGTACFHVWLLTVSPGQLLDGRGEMGHRPRVGTQPRLDAVLEGDAQLRLARPLELTDQRHNLPRHKCVQVTFRDPCADAKGWRQVQACFLGVLGG